MKHTQEITKFRVHNNPVVQNTWTYKKGISKKQIEEAYNGLAKELFESGHKGEISLNILFKSKDGGPAKWRCVDKFREINDDIKFKFDEDAVDDYWGVKIDDDKFEAFQILVTKNDRLPRGGCGSQNGYYNHCFYECLDKVIPNILRKVFPTPADLKEHCGLDKYDAFPLEKIPEVEAVLPDCRINVMGDYVYTSTKKAINTITLNLWDEHYVLATEKLNRARGVVLEEKAPAIFEFITDRPDHVKIYDGEELRVIRYSKFRQWQSKPRSAPYILIKSDRTGLEEQYRKFIADANILKEKTNGRFNLYKSGTVVNAALNRFYELNSSVIPDPIEQDEAQWLSDCNMGGLMWAKKGYKGEGWKYDINSAYPAILANPKFSFPVKRGEFKRISQQEFDGMKFIEYGIYRAKIYDADYRLLPTRKKTYVHFDLVRAKELGYRIEIIEDDKPNLLSYAGPNMRLSGNAFKEFVKELYELKKSLGKQFPIFKKQITVLWGALCRKNIVSKFLNKEEYYDLPVDQKLLKTINFGNNHVTLKSLKLDTQYITDFARLGPFLLSRCRCMMSRIIERNIDNVVRVHTDGFISTKKMKFKRQDNNCPIDQVKLGTDLGDIKFEGHRELIEIQGVNKIIDY